MTDVLLEGSVTRIVSEEQCERHGGEGILDWRPRIDTAVDEAHIGDDVASARAALVEHCGWNRHEVEALLVLKLQDSCDCCSRRRRSREQRAL